MLATTSARLWSSSDDPRGGQGVRAASGERPLAATSRTSSASDGRGDELR